MPVKISYTNALGEEIILDHTEWKDKWLWSHFGSEGLEAPALRYKEIVYGNGSTEVVVSQMEPREVVLYFVVKTGAPDLRMKLEELKQQLIQTGTRTGGWGRLKILRPDGVYLHLNAIYTGGLDEFIRKYRMINKFALTFRANDPLFYEGFVTRYVIEADAAGGYLMMKDLSFPDGYDFARDNCDDNPDGLYMMDLDDPDHDDADHNPDSVYMKSAANESGDEIDVDGQKIWPSITISGSAKNIRLYNALTGKKIEFAADVVVDGANSIRIETRPFHRKVVRIDGTTGAETSIIGRLTPDSSLEFCLERGTNLIYYRNSESTPESKCVFEYTEGYLSAE